MKSKIQLLLCITAFSLLPLRAADNENKSPNVARHLQEIELSLILRQYERVRTEVYDIKYKTLLLEAEAGMPQDERKKQTDELNRKEELLASMSEELRNEAMRLGDEMAGTTKSK